MYHPNLVNEKGSIMYVYIVVFMINGLYSVQAPNVVFPDLQSCEDMKEVNAKVLRQTTPTPSAKFYAQCIKIPKDIII